MSLNSLIMKVMKNMCTKVTYLIKTNIIELSKKTYTDGFRDIDRIVV